ncbi:cell division protein FtsA [Rubritalea squalenifaciens DSM 18772]|uniref:Cell division protein FtsA n=2 Tax=Rubritalea TaxID=361050 RepID=A0A1M6M2V0_9BACT|nr:cell division protein FtsA [Rubritalea squalenifaciens]SHJ77687.1 cell division protein FtsA [Rubritalea squalenifaciens DSM 18772]
MAKSKIHVGLEIGTSKTCMVVGEVKVDGSVKILGVGETKSVGVRKGEISDYAQVRTCVREALLEAEDVCDVDINSVFLSVTGSHIKGVNNRGTYRLPDDEQEILPEHVEEAKEIARDIAIPTDDVYLHNVVRQYWLDGEEHSTTPVGLLGRTLEADFHIIHGIRTRIQNSIKCVREIPLDVDDVVFAPIASAQIALNRQRKDAGALVIDIGGGTTDYVLYLDGAIAASGCIPVGGDHVTNDIHLVTHMPLSKAEKVKKTEGDASGDPARSVGVVTIPDEKGFPELEVKRQLLNDIIRGRLEETLNLVKERLPEGALQKIGTGVFLTGGTSLMRGFGELANEVFNLPIYRPEQPEVSGVHAYFRDPQYSTAVGLIRYAQLMDEDRPKKSTGGLFGALKNMVWPFGA